jgi:hypothetical protein
MKSIKNYVMLVLKKHNSNIVLYIKYFKHYYFVLTHKVKKVSEKLALVSEVSLI